MLRISHSETELGERWTLCGQLRGPWVQALRSCWQHAPALHAVVDLSEVTFIDKSGERLLSDMRDAGVEFIATGVETKHLLENLSEGK